MEPEAGEEASLCVWKAGRNGANPLVPHPQLALDKIGRWHASSPSIWMLKMTRHLVGKMWV